LTPALAEFEDAMLPHLDAAFNLARHLTGDDHEAEDVVQDACLRALKYFSSFRGGNGKAWLLRIVRHTFYTRWRRRGTSEALTTAFDEEVHGMETSARSDPERSMLREDARRVLTEAMAALPPSAREVIVLRELEGLSYDEISRVMRVPIGTVMSRLARARERLQAALSAHASEWP
jgi:RNA polymerase sigma-70 factor (ECF subfamily)